MNQILLADDDQVLSDLLTEFLTARQLNVTQVFDGGAAIQHALNQETDLIVLDVMMPVKDGFEVLREVRKSSQVPVLMLTAKGEDVDRITGLEMGADDYLPKPCNPRELLARINAILRRVEQSSVPATPELFELEDLTLKTADRSVFVDARMIELTAAEYNILEALIRRPGEVISKEELTEKGMSRKLELFDRSVDMHISNLRKKLGKNGAGEQRIKTVRGIGYLLSSAAKKLTLPEMHRLFWKIFTLLWCVSAAVFVCGFFIANRIHLENAGLHPIEDEARLAIEAFEDNRLKQYYASQVGGLFAHQYLLDENNRLLPIGYAPTENVPALFEFPFEMRQGRGAEATIVRGMELQSDTDKRYRFIVKYGHHRSHWRSFMFPLFFIAFAATSVFLSAYITRPLRKLQTVVRRFAAGEHDARMTERYTKRRDVVGEVGREFNAMAERLNAQLESQRKLLRDISHELRTPLARMQVAVAIAEEKTTGAPESLARLHTEIERLDGLIGQVLQLSRIESGEGTLNKKSFSVSRLLSQVAVDAEFEFSEQGKSIRVDISDDINFVADQYQLQSAIENIIRNAMRYTPANSVVQVHAERLPVADDAGSQMPIESLRLTIRDHGPGASTNNLPKLFDAFYREDDSRHAGSGGHGVGLAIARGIVTAHGGVVRAINHPDGGLQVEVVLPDID